MQEALLRVHRRFRCRRAAGIAARVRRHCGLPGWRSPSCTPAAPAASATSASGCQEPIVTDGHDDPARHAETADSLSLAMLVLLESFYA